MVLRFVIVGKRVFLIVIASVGIFPEASWGWEVCVTNTIMVILFMF
jgi:hypothetical protein